MTKDRVRRELLNNEGSVYMVVERSSTHPVEYAYMLIALHQGEWHTIRTFDNAHAAEEQHEHAYIRNEKQPPVTTEASVNDAMVAAERKIRLEWADIVYEWKQTWHQ